jgi:hypothetical protein
MGFWTDVRNEIRTYRFFNNAPVDIEKNWGQIGGGKEISGIISVDGREFKWRQSKDGSTTVVYFGEKIPECALLFIEKGPSGLYGVLQGILKGFACYRSSYATTKELLKAIWNLAFIKGLQYIEFADTSKLACPDDEKISLVDMYFITYGKTWYETIWPIYPKYDIIEKYRKIVANKKWKTVYSALPDSVKHEFVPQYSGIDENTPGSAMKVMQLYKAEDACLTMKHHMKELIDAFGISTLEHSNWITRTINTPFP